MVRYYLIPSMEIINAHKALTRELAVLELKLEHSMRVTGILSEQDKIGHKAYEENIVNAITEIRSLIDYLITPWTKNTTQA